MKAYDALQKFGVVADLSGQTPANMASLMNSLGINLLRSKMTTTDDLNFLLALQKLVPGFRLQFLMTAYENNPATESGQFALLLQAKQAGLNVESIEGTNETNNPDTGGGSHMPGQTALVSSDADVNAAMVAWSSDISAWVKSNWPSVKRLGGTVIAYDLDTYKRLIPSLVGKVDASSVHVYPQPGQQPSNLDGSGDQGDPAQGGAGDQFHMVAWEQIAAGSVLPVALTESGSPGGPVVQPGRVVDYMTQAITILNIGMDALAQGVDRLNYYCLRDPGDGDPNNNEGPESHYGLFKGDNTPKPVVSCLSGFLKLLNDPGGNNFTEKQLLVTVDNLLGTQGRAGCVVPLALSNGGYVIPVWNEPSIFKNNAPVTPSPVSAHVGWGSVFNYTVFDGLTGKTVVSGSDSSVMLTFQGYPLFVVLTPVKTTTGSVTSATPVTTPSTPASPVNAPASVAVAGDTLTLDEPLAAGVYVLEPVNVTGQSLSVLLSEDAYQGDSLVDVALDGNVLFSSLPVIQLRSGGGRQSVPLGTVDTTKPHTVIVTFLNDLYGGDGMDRNVYIEAYTLGNKTITVNTPLYSAGPGTLQIPAQ